eukprot:10975562-Alexandrium_andersonii.AAC.1
MCARCVVPSQGQRRELSQGLQRCARACMRARALWFNGPKLRRTPRDGNPLHPGFKTVMFLVDHGE